MLSEKVRRRGSPGSWCLATSLWWLLWVMGCVWGLRPRADLRKDILTQQSSQEWDEGHLWGREGVPHPWGSAGGRGCSGGSEASDWSWGADPEASPESR